MNMCVFVGRLTSDPKVKTLENGNTVVRFRLAVSRYPRKEGEPTADFFNCVVWGKRAENFAKLNISKSTKLILSGEMRNSSFTDKKGIERNENELQVDTFEFAESRQSHPETEQISPWG